MTYDRAVRPRAPQRERPPRSPTKLQATLADGGRPARAGPLDAFKLARRRWQAGQRIDMSALARELGVNRMTLPGRAEPILRMLLR